MRLDVLRTARTRVPEWLRQLYHKGALSHCFIIVLCVLGRSKTLTTVHIP